MYSRPIEMQIFPREAVRKPRCAGMQHPKFQLLVVLSLALVAAHAAVAQKKDKGPEPTEKLTYKEVAGTKLEIWVWKPADWKATDKRSAIVFYHGGGWRGGAPTAFSRQSAQLAERGMVACSVQYRLTSQEGVKITDCVKDAKSAFRWVRAHAAELGIDPQKIAAGGGSAGGHLAAALATLDDINDPADDVKISTTPAALVLFNPAANLDFPKATEGKTEEQVKELFAVSPYNHLKAGHPPTIIFHGDADTTVPIATVQAYTAKVKELGGDCEVCVSTGQAHAFFNKEPYVWDTLKLAEAFLRKHALLN
jgi:acetyl esterase/lipase